MGFVLSHFDWFAGTCVVCLLLAILYFGIDAYRRG
jgi:hypothetical protein